MYTGLNIRVENQNNGFFKVMQDSTVNDRLFFIRYTFSKISRERDFGASKHYGSLEKNNQNYGG